MGTGPKGGGNIKVCVIDEGGSLFPLRAHVPQYTLLLTWREMLKNEYDQWVRQGRAEELNRLQKTLCSGGAARIMSVPGCNLGFLSRTTTICGGNVGEGVVLCVPGSGMRVSVPFSDLTRTHCR